MGSREGRHAERAGGFAHEVEFLLPGFLCDQGHGGFQIGDAALDVELPLVTSDFP